MSNRMQTIALLLAVAIVAGCGDDGPTEPADQENGGRPENLVEAIENIYNDKLRDAVERVVAYGELFPPPDHATLPGFLFRLQPDDVIAGLPESWGLDQELAIHERMFGAQDARELFEISLSIEYEPPEPLEFPEPGQESWRSVLATSCHVRLLFNPDDGLEVTGAREEFIAAPADGRWYIVEWTDLPRTRGALPAGVAVEHASWGGLKSLFR